MVDFERWWRKGKGLQRVRPPRCSAKVVVGWERELLSAKVKVKERECTKTKSG